MPWTRCRAYRWPGNVRELENLVRRLTVLYSQETIGLEVIESELSDVDQGDARNLCPARIAQQRGRTSPAVLLCRP